MKNHILTGLTFGLSAFAVANDEITVKPVDGSQTFEIGSREALRTAKTIWGPTGLIFVPTAYTIAPKTLSWGMAQSKDFSSASVGYSLVPDIEFGIAYLDRKDSENKMILNAKVHILPSNFKQFELGIGVMDAAGAVEQSFYVVGSADLIIPDLAVEKGAVGLRIHAGVGTGYFSEKLFGGAELFFDKGLSAVAEWDTKNLNFAVRYAHNDQFFIELGSFSSQAMVKMSYSMRF